MHNNYENLFTYSSLILLSVGAAEHVIKLANKAISERGVFRIALAGGSTPRGLYEVLSGADYASRTNWALWEVYFSDERVVSSRDERSNYAMAKGSLFDAVHFDNGAIHGVPVQLGEPARVAAEYEAQIRRSFLPNDSSDMPQFDLILLGLGSDGHTASLFPGKPALRMVNRLVVESTPGVLPPSVDRATFTVPFINAARHVMFLASGEDKRAAFRAAYNGSSLGDVETVPAHLIQPVSGTLEWFITNELADEIQH